MRRILLVDDSPATRSFVRSSLEDAAGRLGELEIVEASSGFDALRLLPRGVYDLVITDINMPNINGLELLQFIRKSARLKDTPIILISTQSSERDRLRGMSLGATDFVAKPLDSMRLVEGVCRALATQAGT